MNKYNEQHAIIMLNALIGTDTLAEHDKRIRNEVIEELVDSLTCQACFTNMQKDAIRIYAEQMKGEQNG